MSEPSGTQYGGFWVRFLALLADSAIVFLVSAALLAGAAVALGPDGLVPTAFAVGLLALLYWPVMHASGAQATLGKAILGLKVARLDGRRISLLRSLWRELAKIFSAAVLMVGYVLAAFTPRKQGLHDLMAATYVVREGPSRVIPALAVAVAGFALPVVVGPMLVGAALISTMTDMAEGMISQADPRKQAAHSAAPVAKVAPKPQVPSPGQPVQAAKAPPAEEKAVPTPKPKAPAPVAEGVEAKPELVAAAPATTMALAKEAKSPRKPKPATAPVAARASKPAAVPPSAPKLASGPKYNDLMTAVLYRDAEGVTELLKLGKWADKRDGRGVTPLMVAADLGDVRTAEALLRAGADPQLAMSVAEERRHGDMVRLLKRYSRR